MKVPCSNLWPAPDASPEAARQHWSTVAGLALRSLDDTVPFDLERPLLLCIRGAKLGDTETHDLLHRPVYDDCFVLLQRDVAPVAFDGATHAYQRDSKLSPDANRDGRGDVGTVRPGRYVAHDVTAKGDPEIVFRVSMPDGTWRLPCHRDFDHNGILTPEEMQASENLRTGAQVGDDGTWADSILIHGGIEEPANAKHHYSIGCFTTARKWRKIMADAARASGGKLDVVVPLAAHLAALLEDDGDSDRPPPGGVA